MLLGVEFFDGIGRIMVSDGLSAPGRGAPGDADRDSSDTHDQIKRTAAAVGRLIAEGAEVLIHCGDLTTPAVVEQCAGLPSYFVFGNNDFDEARLRRAMEAIGGVCLGYGGLIELGGKRIAVTHGDSGAEMAPTRALWPDYLSFGHPSHRERQPRRLDPIHQPWSAYRASQWTVAVLDLDTDHLQYVDQFAMLA